MIIYRNNCLPIVVCIHVMMVESKAMSTRRNSQRSPSIEIIRLIHGTTPVVVPDCQRASGSHSGQWVLFADERSSHTTVTRLEESRSGPDSPGIVDLSPVSRAGNGCVAPAAPASLWRA